MTVFLVRGLPGSGKTTLARRLRRPGDESFAADDFFCIAPAPEYEREYNREWTGGKYRFDASKLADAHEWCQDRARFHLQHGDDVIVHNTFSQRWEMEPYLRMAEERVDLNDGTPAPARVVVIDLYDAGLDDEELSLRCTHGVPEATIAQMRDRWEHDWRVGNPLPPWERS